MSSIRIAWDDEEGRGGEVAADPIIIDARLGRFRQAVSEVVLDLPEWVAKELHAALVDRFGGR